MSYTVYFLRFFIKVKRVFNFFPLINFIFHIKPEVPKNAPIEQGPVRSHFHLDIRPIHQFTRYKEELEHIKKSDPLTYHKWELNIKNALDASFHISDFNVVFDFLTSDLSRYYDHKLSPKMMEYVASNTAMSYCKKKRNIEFIMELLFPTDEGDF